MISEDDARAELAGQVLRHRARIAGRESDLIRAAALGVEPPPELVGALPQVYAGLQPVGGGWLLWITEHPGTGVRMHVTEGRDGLVIHRWPSWPVHTIVQRILDATPADRFPPVVVAVLEEAGWYPSRALPDDELSAWAAARPSSTQIHLHPAARAALCEFGGLRIRAEGACDDEFFPHDVTDARWQDAVSLARWGGSPLYPVAEDRRERVEGLVVVFEPQPNLPSVVLAGELDQYEAGATVDEMLIKYLTGDRFDVVG